MSSFFNDLFELAQECSKLLIVVVGVVTLVNDLFKFSFNYWHAFALLIIIAVSMAINDEFKGAKK